MQKWLIGFVMVLATLFTNVMAEDNPRAVIIFDASGSMWGQINGKAKIEIARDALKNVVKEWNPNVELGLTVYGHRSKGDCNDIETIIPVGKVDKNKVIRTVMAIKPKGKTPISRSLRKVADEIKYTEEKATIILISDGKETCDPDPCATAKELEKEGIDFVTHVIGFNVDKKTDAQLECIANATGGEYFSAKNAAALNEAMKTIVKKVEKPKPAVTETLLVPVVRYNMSPNGGNLSNVHIVVTQDGKTIYDGKDEAPEFKAKVGTVHIKADYDRVSVPQSIEKDFTLKAQEKNVAKILLKSGKVAIDSAEEQGGPKVKSSVRIYPVIDGEPDKGDEIAWCVLTKKEACEKILPVGDYLIEASYNDMKTQKKFSISDREEKSIHLYFKQTGKVEVTASETKEGKWIATSSRAYKVIDGEVDDSDNWYIGSGKKKPGIKQLPVGKYVLKSSYNAFKNETPFEVKAGETTKLHIIMGSTGKVEVTASEKEAGKWIDANCRAYRIIDGEVDTSDNWYIGPHKKKAGTKQLPVGKYQLKCSYNAFKKTAQFEIKAGETAKVHVVMGSTGKVEVTASEKEGGKWIATSSRAYKVIDGEVDDSDSWYIGSGKKKPGIKQLPVGKYVLKSSYNGLKKETPFEVKSGETTKLHVIFSQFSIGAKCPNGGIKVYYEIYASNGRLVYEKDAQCSESVKLSLDNGDYSVEATIDGGKGEAKFTVGSGKPNKLILDLSNLNHEEEIKADTPEEAVVVPVTPKKTEVHNTQKKSSQINIGGKKIEIEGMSEKEAKQIEQLGAMLGALGGMMQQANDTSNKKQKKENEAADKEFDEMSKDLDMFTK